MDSPMEHLPALEDGNLEITRQNRLASATFNDRADCQSLLHSLDNVDETVDQRNCPVVLDDSTNHSFLHVVENETLHDSTKLVDTLPRGETLHGETGESHLEDDTHHEVSSDSERLLPVGEIPSEVARQLNNLSLIMGDTVSVPMERVSLPPPGETLPWEIMHLIMERCDYRTLCNIKLASRDHHDYAVARGKCFARKNCEELTIKQVHEEFHVYAHIRMKRGNFYEILIDQSLWKYEADSVLFVGCRRMPTQIDSRWLSEVHKVRINVYDYDSMWMCQILGRHAKELRVRVNWYLDTFDMNYFLLSPRLYFLKVTALSCLDYANLDPNSHLYDHFTNFDPTRPYAMSIKYSTNSKHCYSCITNNMDTLIEEMRELIDIRIVDNESWRYLYFHSFLLQVKRTDIDRECFKVDQVADNMFLIELLMKPRESSFSKISRVDELLYHFDVYDLLPSKRVVEEPEEQPARKPRKLVIYCIIFLVILVLMCLLQIYLIYISIDSGRR